MGELRFSHILGALIAVLGCAVLVHGQDSTSTTTSATSGQERWLDTTPSGRMSTTTPSATYSSTSEPTSSASTTEDSKLSDCSTPADLITYCGNRLTPKELKFFGSDTSLTGVLSKILTPKVVYALQEQCVPGEWCLADSYQKNISNELVYFYSTPICQSDPLWMCLEDIEISRSNCNESELFFVMSTIGLMCDMEAIDGGVISTECFTRSMEALHVLYSDISRSVQDEDVKDLCSDYNRKMTNTYACAVNACTMEQRVFLEDFGPWSHTSATAEKVLETCNVDLDCQAGYPTQEAPLSSTSSISSSISTSTNSQPQAPESSQTVSTTDWGKMMESSVEAQEEKLEEEEEIEEAMMEEVIDEFANEMFERTTASGAFVDSEGDDGIDDTVEGVINEQGMEIPETRADADQTFVYGMITVTAVVVVSLTLIGVLTFKRFSRMRNYKLGYSQMTEEESRMLRNEYN